jgi:outer membrane biosynthesis protein TonB
VRVPEGPPLAAAEFRNPASPEPPSRNELKREAPAPGGRESAAVAAIPATFFDPARLTEKPRPLSEPPLDLLHPILATSGVVRLVLYIDENGQVTSTEIDSATLPPAAAERAAAIFAALRFSPGRIDGTAVKTRVRITVGAEERPKER